MSAHNMNLGRTPVQKQLQSNREEIIYWIEHENREYGRTKLPFMPWSVAGKNFEPKMYKLDYQVYGIKGSGYDGGGFGY